MEANDLNQLIGQVRENLGCHTEKSALWHIAGPRHTMPSPFDVTGLAVSSLVNAHLALAELVGVRCEISPPPVKLDSREAAVVFMCERFVQPDGWSLPPAWDPLAGDYRTADGFVRLHTNYAHHRNAVLQVLDVPAERERVAAAVARFDAEALEAAVAEAGGCAAAMRSPQDWRLNAQGMAVAAQPLIERRQYRAPTQTPRWASAKKPSLPLQGIRVLDLTRVIAGPVATRMLAAYGATVLRIDPPGFEEVGALLAETTVGKRRAFLDLKQDADRKHFERLLMDADVLVHGYRRDALPRLGFDSQRLSEINPDLIVTQHTAYGAGGPWNGRRGFDSLVQMSCGIAHRGMEFYQASHPRPLPCQALDHATGYLIAAATVRALIERLCRGHVVCSELSLARTAKLLMDLGETGDSVASAPDALVVKQYMEYADSAFGPLSCVRIPPAIEGVHPHLFRPAGPLGSDEASF